jgi:uncharacterized protein YvpB
MPLIAMVAKMMRLGFVPRTCETTSLSKCRRAECDRITEITIERLRPNRNKDPERESGVSGPPWSFRSVNIQCGVTVFSKK